MRETLHYTGEFKDLIPNGWSFHKLYANNYRCYFYPVNGEEQWAAQLIVWQGKRYVNFPNLFEEASAALMRFLLDGVEFKPYSEAVTRTLGFTGL